MLRAFASSLVCLAFGVAVVGCGSDNPGGLPTTSGGAGSGAVCYELGCGGNIIGTWQVHHACFPQSRSMPLSSCPSGKHRLTNLDATGTVTFSDDGSMQSTLTTTYQEEMSGPPDCFSEALCAQLRSTYDGLEGISGTCSFNATSGCSCSHTGTSTSTVAGTFTVLSSMLTTKSPGAEDSVEPYCASDGSLVYQLTSEDGPVTLSATK